MTNNQDHYHHHLHHEQQLMETATHLVVFQHGLLGAELDFANVATLFRAHLSVSDGVFVHVASCNATSLNSVFATWDGVDHGAERLASEVVRVASALPQLTKFSLVGHSMGGLYARYCLGVLYARGFFDRIEPMNFVTLATPHLGNRRPQRGSINLLYNAIAPLLFDRTGRQFALLDDASNETIALSSCVENKYPHRRSHEACQELEGVLLVSFQKNSYQTFRCELRNRVLSLFHDNQDSAETGENVLTVSLLGTEVLIIVPEKSSTIANNSVWDLAILPASTSDETPICTIRLPHSDFASLWKWIPALSNASANVRCCSPSTVSSSRSSPSANALFSCLTRGQFMLALQLFRVRTLYATVFNDHTVPYSCAAVRAFNPYRLESEAALATSPTYDHILERTMAQAPLLRDTLPFNAKARATATKKTTKELEVPREGEQNGSTSDADTATRSAPLMDGALLLDHVEEAFSTDEARDTLRGMLVAVQSVGWRRLDVRLDSLLAHEMIIAKRSDIANAPTDGGLDIVHHLIDSFVL